MSVLNFQVYYPSYEDLLGVATQELFPPTYSNVPIQLEEACEPSAWPPPEAMVGGRSSFEENSQELLPPVSTTAEAETVQVQPDLVYVTPNLLKSVDTSTTVEAPRQTRDMYSNLVYNYMSKHKKRRQNKKWECFGGTQTCGIGRRICKACRDMGGLTILGLRTSADPNFERVLEVVRDQAKKELANREEADRARKERRALWKEAVLVGANKIFDNVQG